MEQHSKSPHKHRKSKNLKRLEEYKRIGLRLGIQGMTSEDGLHEVLIKALTKLDLMHYVNQELESQIRELIVSRSKGDLINRLNATIKDLKEENQHLRKKVKELEASFDEQN